MVGLLGQEARENQMLIVHFAISRMNQFVYLFTVCWLVLPPCGTEWCRKFSDVMPLEKVMLGDCGVELSIRSCSERINFLAFEKVGIKLWSINYT